VPLADPILAWQAGKNNYILQTCLFALAAYPAFLAFLLFLRQIIEVMAVGALGEVDSLLEHPELDGVDKIAS
jgi:hypothetical protein